MADSRAATWVLHWATDREDTPRVIHSGNGGLADVNVFRMESGGFAVFDGYLFDREELGARSEERDAAVVARAYQRWGETLFDKLRGSFTLGIWDDERQALIAGRDAMGLNPFFYAWDGRGFVMSASLDAVLAQPGVDSRFDRVVLAEYIQNTLAPQQTHETFYQGVRRLPAAHALHLGNGQLTIRRYWDPVPPGFGWASREEASRFPDVLRRAVGRCLNAGADSLGLSGGFDSIGLAVLAAEELPERPLHAVSLRYANTPCDEGPTQTAVAEALGMPLLQQTVEESLGGQSLVHRAFALSGQSNCPILSIWQPAYAGLLRSAAQRGLDGLTMGTGGDEMLVVDTAYGADCLVTGDLRALWQYYRACRRTSPFSALRTARTVFWRGALAPELRRLARSTLRLVTPAGEEWLRRQRRRRFALRPWLSQGDVHLAAALQDRRCEPAVIEMAPGERSYVRAIRHLPQMPLLQLETEQAALFNRNFGFSLFLPYFDRDVVELLLRTSPADLIDGGYHKAPLRRLVAGRLPTLDFRAKKVTYVRMAHDELRTHGRAMWREFGGPAMLDDLGLVRIPPVNTFMEDYFAGRNENALQAWLFLSAEMWLRARINERAVAVAGRLQT